MRCDAEPVATVSLRYAERQVAIGDLKTCQYMERFKGQRLRASIQRVSFYGIEVFLKEHYVTGFIPARLFEGRKKVDGPRLEISSRRGARVFEEGDPIEIVVTDVDFIRLQVLLTLPELLGKGGPAKN